MGILSALLGDSNPAAKWAQQNRGWVGQIGAGIAAGPTFEQGLANAAMMGPQGQRIDDAYAAAEAEKAARQDQINQTSEYLAKTFPDLAQAVSAGMPLDSAWNEAMKRSQPGYGQTATGDNLMSVGGHIYDKASGQWISPPSSADNRQNVSLTGQWARDAQGNPVYLQPSSTGEMVQAQVPEGVQLLGPFDVSADRAAGGAFGKQTGGAQFDLPSAKLIASQTIGALNDIRAEKKGMEEQFGNILGVPQQMTPAYPGSDKAKFQVAVQRGTDRAFLEAREMLRGGGQITDFESRKAETAITSMQLAMEKGDKAQFEKALNDFEQAVKDGVAKLESQASAMPGYGSAPVAAPTAGADYKTKYGLE
jgi:hypothetical protein